MIRTRVDIPLKEVKAEFVTFRFPGHDAEDIAILFPGWKDQKHAIVRIHSECLTGDVFGSKRCDCNAQLHEAMDMMAINGGIILYLRQEGRNIGLYNKLDAYDLQVNKGMDTFEANAHLGLPLDARNYLIAAEMLKDLGINNIRLLTNNPDKTNALIEHGIKIHESVATGTHIHAENIDYLRTKKKHGHKLAA